jgi:hypothetical protein
LLAGISEGLEKQREAEERAKALARQEALENQYLAMINAILEEKAAQVRALDAERSQAAERERRRLESAYRLFQPKLTSVVTQYADSIGIRGQAYDVLLKQVTAVAQDIFVASPDASEEKIKGDLRPVFVRFAARGKIANAELSSWIRKNSSKILMLGTPPKSQLLEDLEVAYDRYVASLTTEIDYSKLDSRLESFIMNRSLCIALNQICVESDLTPRDQRLRRAGLARLDAEAFKQRGAVSSAIKRFASSNANFSALSLDLLRERVNALLAAETSTKIEAIPRLVANEAGLIVKAKLECENGSKCDQSLVDSVTYSRYASISGRFRRVCAGFALGRCNAILVSSDKPGEVVEVNGKVVGITPLQYPLIAGATSYRVVVGEAAWRVETEVNVVPEFTEVDVVVRTITGLEKRTALNRTAIAQALGANLPTIPDVPSPNASKPAEVSWKRAPIIGALYVGGLGGLAAGLCEKGYSRTECLRDGAIAGLITYPLVLWSVNRSVNKQKKAYRDAEKKRAQLLENQAAVKMRREEMIDSALVSERVRQDNYKVVRQINLVHRR